MLRRVLILVSLAPVLAACGSYADGDQGSLESVVAEEISQQIERDAPMVRCALWNAFERMRQPTALSS